MLPERIKLSQRTTDKLRYLKSQIGVAPNILARFSIMLAIKEGGNLKNTGTLDTEGLELNKSTLFGEHASVYEALIKQYIHDNSLEIAIPQVISSLIDVGVFKLGHVRKLSDLCELNVVAQT